MRKGGLLDRFPLHLFVGGSEGPPILIIDSSDLGRLHLMPLPEGCGTIIALADDKVLLQQTREAMSDIGERFQLVQADAGWLPFRDQSVEVVVAHSTREAKASRGGVVRGSAGGVHEDVGRVLTHRGRLVEVSLMSDPPAVRDVRQPQRWAQGRTFCARPACGSRYFVTPKWVPSHWPFRSIHHGRLRSLRISIDVLISRLKIRPLYDGARLVVYSKVHYNGLIERWTRDPDSNGHRGTASHHLAQNGFGIFINVAGLNALLQGGDESTVIVKFPLGVRAMQAMKKHLDNVSLISAKGNPALTSLLPKIVDHGVIRGQGYWVESRLEGVAGTVFRYNRGWKRVVAQSALDFLLDLHTSTRQPTQISRSIVDELLEPHVATVEEKVKKFEPNFDLSSLVEALWDIFRDREIPFVRTHGDFWPGNLLISDRGRLTGVLDWDLSVARGWPMLDLLHFIAFQHKWRATELFGSIVTGRLMRRRFTSWERELVSRYCASLAIEDDLWAGFVAVYWLNRVSSTIDHFSQGWHRRNVLRPLPRIVDALLSG